MSRGRHQFRSHHTVIIAVISLLLLGTAAGLLAFFIARSDRMKPISDFVKPDPLPKYFAVDVDHTFYVRDPEVFKYNVEAFKSLKAKNITAFFCTGRDFPSNRTLLGEDFFTETGYNGYPGIYANGSLVYDPEGNAIKLDKFSEDFLEKFYTFVVHNNLQDKTTYHTDKGVYSLDKLYDTGLRFINHNKIVLPIITTQSEILKMNVVSIAFPSTRFEIAGLKRGLDYQLKISNRIIAQLSPGQSTKMAGLKVLMEYFKTDGSNCAFIGDGDNDKEAMEYCNPSFAVGNALDDVKQHSTWVVDLNHDEGAFTKVVNLMYN